MLRLRIQLFVPILAALLSAAMAQMTVTVHNDPVTGKSAVVSIPMSSSDASGGTPYALDSVHLTYRCDNDGLAVYLVASDWQTFAGYPADIIYRFAGSAPSQTRQWDPSTNGMGVFLPDDLLTQFITDSENSKSLAIRWSLMSGMASNTFVYDLSAFQVKAMPVLQSCLTNAGF